MLPYMKDPQNKVPLNLLFFILALFITVVFYLISVYFKINIEEIPAVFFIITILFFITMALLMNSVITNRLTRKIAEEQSKTQEIIDRYETLNKATNEGIWDYDILTSETFYNDRLLEMFGYAKEDLKDNHSWWRDNIHPDDWERVKLKIDEKLENADYVWQDEYRFRGKDGKYKIVDDRSYIVRNASGRPVRLIGAMNDITHEREQQEAVVTKKLEHKNEMGKAIMQAQEEERRLLRTELHEDINQVLASIKLCFHDIYNQGKADELVKEGIAQLDEVIFKIRKISNTLSPSGLEYFGIIASIKDIISFKETVYPVTFRFTHNAFTEERIQKELCIFIYRIITDLINNMFFAENEKPSEIAIDIKNADKQLQIIISDNSPMTDTRALVSQRNIAGLQNKLEMYNGQIDVSIREDKRIVTTISLNT